MNNMYKLLNSWNIISNEINSSIEECLDKLYDEGWELIAVSNGIHYFKRGVMRYINRNDNGSYQVEIHYWDGTVKIEDNAVDSGYEIAVYESDLCDSEMKYTIYPDNQLIKSIKWL